MIKPRKPDEKEMIAKQFWNKLIKFGNDAHVTGREIQSI